MDGSPSPRRTLSLETALLVLITAAYCLWVLHLPVFPTQDGPMHLYYTVILKAIFAGHPGPFAQFFYIKHVLPPYAIYYYALLAYLQATPIFLADKLVICTFFIVFITGFRFLARSIGPSADRATLLATLLLLNWPLGMGFLNFCLSLAFALWTIGLWLRLARSPRLLYRVVFAALIALITISHPLPLLLVLLVCGLELAVRLWRHRRVPTASMLPAHFAPDCLLLAIAAIASLGYVKLFTIANVLQQTRLPSPYRDVVKLHLRDFPKATGLSFFSHGHADAHLYRALLIGLVPFALVLALRQFRRNRAAKALAPGDLWLAAALACLCILPFLPTDINSSHLFAERLVILIWIAALLAMSGSALNSRWLRAAVIAYALLGTAVTLESAQRYLAPEAQLAASYQDVPITHHGRTGVLLRDDSPTSFPDGLAFNPRLWTAVHYFRRNDANLYNTPWLDLMVIPLGGTPASPTGQLRPEPLEIPALLTQEMRASPATRSLVFSKIDFILLDTASSSAPRGIAALLAQDPDPRHSWTLSESVPFRYQIFDLHELPAPLDPR